MSGGLAFAAFAVSILEEQQRQKAGKAQESDLRRESRELGIAAQDREIERRRYLNRVLSAQAAQFAGSGIDANIGSARSIMESSAAEAQRDYQKDTANVAKKQKLIAKQIRQMRKARRQKAFTNVVGSAFNAYQSGGQ